MSSEPQDSGWLAPNARWLMTHRHGPVGGTSQGVWGSLNLGDHVGDDAAHVAENRRRLDDWLTPQGAHGARYLRQVHGKRVAGPGWPAAQMPEADAAVATQAGEGCTMLVADCLPVLMAAVDAQGQARAVAAAHAGWRGLADGVLDTTLDALCRASALSPTAVRAWLGPCIGPNAFEVGGEVRDAFVHAHGSGASSLFRPSDAGSNTASGEKFWANLAGLARSRLDQLGVPAANLTGNDSSAPWCTVSDPSRFFSHRRDAARLGSSGRMAACIWLTV